MARKIDREEFEKRLNEKTNTIIATGEYLGWNMPMNYHCLICGNDWVVQEARSVYRGYWCPECGKQKSASILKMMSKSRVKSEREFQEELIEKHPNLIPNDTYVNDCTKYHCICKIHNCDVYTTPEKYLRRNQGCKLCAVEKNKCEIRYTHESFVEKLSSINPNLEVLSEYTNIKNKIHIGCKICGYKWNPLAESLIAKISCGCPSCAGNAIKDATTFEEELKITHPELQLLSSYIRSNKKVHVLCTDCNRDFWVTPNKLQQGQHCPNCKISHGEHLVRNILTNLNISFKMQMKYDGLNGIGGRKLSYDFYLPTYNLLIEFQGEQHERPVIFKGTNKEIAEESFKKQQEHDKRKREYAKLHNIRLLEIWYYDINNIESIILNALNTGKQKCA